MKKQIIIRATLIAAPAVAVMILALLCFDENGQTPIMEIEAPVRVVETAMPPVSASLYWTSICRSCLYVQNASGGLFVWHQIRTSVGGGSAAQSRLPLVLRF